MEQEITDDELRELEEELGEEQGIAPLPQVKDSIFKFFRDILKLKNTTKVANLQETEIGRIRKPTRQYFEVALFADKMGMVNVADYYTQKAFISSTTSMGKKGFWSQLFVTQIKKEQKLAVAPQAKTGFFGKAKTNEGGNQ